MEEFGGGRGCFRGNNGDRGHSWDRRQNRDRRHNEDRRQNGDRCASTRRESYGQSKLKNVDVGDGGLTLSDGSSECGGEEQGPGSSNELHNSGGVVDWIKMLTKAVNEGCWCQRTLRDVDEMR